MIVCPLLYLSPTHWPTISRPPVNRSVADRSLAYGPLANLASAKYLLDPMTAMLDLSSVLSIAVVPVILIAAFMPVPFPIIVIIIAPPVIVIIVTPAVIVFVWVARVPRVLGGRRCRRGPARCA